MSMNLANEFHHLQDYCNIEDYLIDAIAYNIQRKATTEAHLHGPCPPWWP